MRPPRTALALALLAGCGPEPCPPGSARAPATGLCTLIGEDADSGQVVDTPDEDDGQDSGTDTGDPEPLELTLGDPITLLASLGDAPGPDVELVEWVEATPIGDSHVLMSGQGGAQLFSMEDGSMVGEKLRMPRTFRSAVDGTDVILGGRGGGLYPLSFADPANPTESPRINVPEEWGYFEDIDFAAGRILLGFHDRGGQLLDTGGTPLATLPATDAYGVGLSEDRAVITDLEELVLFDISDPRNPVELDRVPMIGEGRDIDFDGSRVAVGLGGMGVGVWDIEADLLVPRGTATLPGSALDVSVDGDEVWVGAWHETALVRVTDEGLLLLGMEAPEFSAMAVGATGGRAMVADWFGVQLLERNRDVAGPELAISEALRFQEGGQTLRADVRNWGPEPLTVQFGSPSGGFTVDPSSVTIAPGGFERVSVTAPATLEPVLSTAEWTSDDPDESSGFILLSVADRGVGTQHEDFTMQGFSWPDPSLSDFTLSEQRGKVVFLAYFALY